MKIRNIAIGAAAAAGIALLGAGAGAAIATHTDHLHNPGICHIAPNELTNPDADPYGDWVRHDMVDAYRIETTAGIGNRSDLAVFTQRYPQCSVDPVVWAQDDDNP